MTPIREHRYYALARQLYEIFARESWTLSRTWENEEPWVRAAWLKVACFAKDGQFE